MKTLLPVIRRLTQGEDGIALILAIVVMMVVAIMAASAVALVTSTQNTSSNDRQSASAFNAADAGLDVGVNAIAAAWNGTSLPSGAISIPTSGTNTVAGGIDGNSVTWKATYAPGTAGAAGIWTVTSSATSPNGKVKRTLQQVVQSTESTGAGQPASFYANGLVTWGTPNAFKNADQSLISGNTICSSPSVTTIDRGASTTAPVWTNGDVCVTGGASPAFANPSTTTSATDSIHRISVHIGGGFYEDNVDPAIGTQTFDGSHDYGPVKSIIVGNAGCVPNAHGSNWAIPISCSSNPPGSSPNDASNLGSGVWADNYTGAADPVPAPTKPPLGTTQEVTYYNDYAVSSVTGQAQKCLNTGGSTPFTDTDSSSTPNTRMSGSVPQTVNLVTMAGATAWDCVTANGELKWTPGTPGKFEIHGAFFIDANITFDSHSALYTGNGTLYVDGTVFFGSGGGFLCAQMVAGQTGCDPSWTGLTGQPMLTLVALNHAHINDNPPTAIGFDLNYTSNGSSKFQGIAYTNGKYAQSHGSEMDGSVVADYADISGNGNFTVPSSPASNSPGATAPTPTYTWTAAPATWRQCPSGAGCAATP